MKHSDPARRMTRAVGLLAAIAASAVACGCAVVGGAVESYRKTSTHPVEALYTGLQGKTFAVVVSADRMIEANNPGLLAHVTRGVAEALRESRVPAGYIPPEQTLEYLANYPQWVARSRTDLAEELGVDRLIVVTIEEYRLNDPGNAYLWEGVASGRVGVIERDSPIPEEYAFERGIRVTFPDQSGVSRSDMAPATVTSMLARRFTERASWIFFTHEEPYYPTY